jgi:FtsH-binding integral membrane protein
MRDQIRRLIAALARLITESDTTLAEFWSSTMLVVMGAWLLVPFAPGTFATLPTYKLMAHMAPEWIWGFAAMGLGAVQSFANLARNRGVRRSAAFVCSIFLGFVAMLVFISVPESLMPPICGVAAFLDGVVFLHLRSRMENRLRAVA